MSANTWTEVQLMCNAPQCWTLFAGERGIRPTSGETVAEVRKRAAAEGWTMTRSTYGRRSGDRDFCPKHSEADWQAALDAVRAANRAAAAAAQHEEGST